MLDERGIYAIGNNQLKGLIKVNVEQKGSNFKLIYITTGFVTLKEHLRNTMNKDMFAKLLQNILNILQSIQDANFYKECILFDINYVVVNPSTQNIYFIYVPIQGSEGFGTLRDFLLSVVQNGSFAPGEDPTYIREYVSILNKKSDFSLFDLRDYINTISPSKSVKAAAKNGKVRCPRCNSPISDNIKFCASCGANVTGLTGEFRGSQQFNPPAGAEPPRSNPRRGDSQPIDLMGIPTIPPQLKKPEPPKSSAAPVQPQFPPQQSNPPRNTGSFQQNRPQFPPQNNFAPAGNAPQYPPQSNFAPAGNVPQAPQQNDVPKSGLQYNFSEPPKSSEVVNIVKSFREEQMNIVDDDPYFGGTVVLTDHSPSSSAAYLIRNSTGEKTAIDKPQFTVGRMLGHVDYCVTNNSAIGRQHMRITNNNGRYFICDLNSTNGTYIDEREIPKNVDTEVFSGAKVTLANEDFKFVIE